MTRNTTPATGDTPETNVEGLSSAEVEERVAAGKTNANTDVKTKSVRQILAEHTFTLFNGVNVAMAILVAITGQWRNLLFIGVVICNLVIGVFQEIRAKRMVDKLSILTEKRVRVKRDGQVVELLPSELVLDDCILLAHGEQVPADSVVLRGQVQMDESLLTGESRPVPKGPGDTLLSGSFIDSGDLLARVTKVGQQGYAARINAEAKYLKPVHSQILDSLRAIIRLGTYVLFPLGIGLFLRTLFMDSATLNDAILSAVAAVVGMTSRRGSCCSPRALAIATTRLASRKGPRAADLLRGRRLRASTLCASTRRGLSPQAAWRSHASSRRLATRCQRSTRHWQRSSARPRTTQTTRRRRFSPTQTRLASRGEGLRCAWSPSTRGASALAA